MIEQQFFSFYEPNPPSKSEKPFSIEIREIEATEEEKKEFVSTMAEIIYNRIMRGKIKNE